jgi:hypothetical protein
MSGDNDKLADALHALTSGDNDHEPVHEEVHDDAHAAPPAAEAPPAAAPPPPAAAPVAAPRPAAPASARPAMPTPANRPTPQPQPDLKASRPARPTMPTPATQPVAAAPAAAPVRQSRPSAPTPASTPAPVAAAPVEYARKKIVVKKKKSFMQTLEFRQTIIPSCLVFGVTCPLLTLIFFLLPETNAIRHASLVLPLSVLVVGLLLLALGVMNMLLVKKELDAQKTQNQS